MGRLLSAVALVSVLVCLAALSIATVSMGLPIVLTAGLLGMILAAAVFVVLVLWVCVLERVYYAAVSWFVLRQRLQRMERAAKLESGDQGAS